MSPETAEKIINEYGAAIASIKEGEVVQDVFMLPYSPAKIRYAYFVYTEALIQKGILDDKTANELEQTYAMLDTRFVENASEINKAWPEYSRNKSAFEIIEKNGGPASFIPSAKRKVEFNNFIADCQGNWLNDKELGDV